MSTAARKGDVERTATMLDLIHRRYDTTRVDMPPAYVVVEEVAPGTAWGGGRYADVLALSCWKSNGFTLDGYEIKASRADLKRELADPSKSQAMARYCDSWTLVAWDRSILVGFTIPETWGIMVAGDGELEKIKKPTKLTPEPWPRSFICSLVRNAHQQAPGAAYLGRACAASWQDGRTQGESIARGDIEHAVKPLGVAIYGKDVWSWPTEDPEAIIAEAVKLVKPIQTRISDAIANVTGVERG